MNAYAIIEQSPCATAMHKVGHICLLFLLALPALGQTFFVARTTPSVQLAETFQINGKDTVRSLAEPAAALDSRTYSRLPKVRLAGIPVLRREGKNVYQISADGKRTVVVPDEARIQGSTTPEALWAQATITAAASRRDHPITIPFEEWTAAGAGGSAAGIAFVLARHNFSSLDEQLLYLKVTEGDQVAAFLDRQMKSALSDFENAGSYDRLLEGQRYAAVAPASLAQTAQSLRERRALVDSTLAALEVLFNNRRWDEFLDKYSAIERYENAFPRMKKNRRRALLETAHVNARQGRMSLALSRDPANKPLQDLAEQKRLEAALAAAASRAKGPSPDSAEGVRLTRHINLASRYLTDKNFAEAERELTTAAGVDKDSPRLLLLRARLHKDRNNLVAALTTLNEYDERASDPADRRAGEELRVEIMYNLNKQRTDARQTLASLFTSRRYAEGLAAATRALELDSRDPEFLWHAGVFSAVLRRQTAGRFLADFLEVTNSLAADPDRRRLVYRLTSLASAPTPAEPCKLPPAVFYCPETLAFQPRIASIRAGNATQTFEWAPDGKLTAIRRPPGPALLFDYFPGSKQVSRVSLEKSDAAPVQVNPLSHPAMNMQVVALLEGAAPATGFAGNPYFNPFVWTELHSFRFAYDGERRVEQAAEIGGTRLARFQWDGDRLQTISVFADKDTERPAYRRSLAYSGDRLVSENVEFGGRQYRINYKYVGDRLSEAEFDDSGAHDGLSRTVRFQ